MPIAEAEAAAWLVQAWYLLEEGESLARWPAILRDGATALRASAQGGTMPAVLLAAQAQSIVDEMIAFGYKKGNMIHDGI